MGGGPTARGAPPRLLPLSLKSNPGQTAGGRGIKTRKLLLFIATKLNVESQFGVRLCSNEVALGS